MAQESCNLDKDEPEILKPSPSPSPAPPSPTPAPTPLFLKPPFVQRSEPSIAFSAAAGDESQPPVRFGNRCSSCRKRVGLTGFRCRCGDLFCPRHRYSDTHDCSFDYKAAGREEISKANPVIRAAKIIKI